MTLRFVFGIFSISVFFTSCRKIYQKKVTGDYTCEVYSQSFDLYSGFWDTTYFKNVTVEQVSKSVKVFDKEIDVDEIRKGQTFRVGDYSYYYEIRLYNDSLYYKTYSGGHGGNGSTTYRGVKTD